MILALKAPQRTHSVSLDAGESGGSGESTSSLQEENKLINVNIEFFFSCNNMRTYNHLMTFALNGHHSPEGQQLHAHRGDRVCQAHPVEDTQSGDQYVEVSPQPNQLRYASFRQCQRLMTCKRRKSNVFQVLEGPNKAVSFLCFT